MILALAPVLAFAQATPVPLPPEEDVVVIGRRLDKWRGDIRTTASRTSCTTKRSTGDPEIDAVGCTAMERCWPDVLPRIKAAQVKGIAKAERKRLETAAGNAFAACVKPQRATLIEALRARRAAARRAVAGAGA